MSGSAPGTRPPSDCGAIDRANAPLDWRGGADTDREAVGEKVDVLVDR
ncbi:MAG: hypothetical protein WBO04_07130 [Steroidobacteraceae bacterium]